MSYRSPPNLCPYCDILVTQRWHEGSPTTSDIYYLRCQQCGTLFILTTQGWDDIETFHRYDFHDVDPREEPSWQKPSG